MSRTRCAPGIAYGPDVLVSAKVEIFLQLEKSVVEIIESRVPIGMHDNPLHSSSHDRRSSNISVIVFAHHHVEHDGSFVHVPTGFMALFYDQFSFFMRFVFCIYC